MSKKIFALLAAILLLPMMISAADAAPHRKAHGAKTYSSTHKVIKRAYHGNRRAYSRRATSGRKHAHRASSRRHASRGRSYRSSYRSADRATRPGPEVHGVSYSSGSRHAAGGRPSKWCGWWMRTQRGGGAHLNVAWNWRNYGSPASPQVGAVVVWRHHVGQIVGQAANGRWLVQSGNDGNAVRTRARSISGAVIRM